MSVHFSCEYGTKGRKVHAQTGFSYRITPVWPVE